MPRLVRPQVAEGSDLGSVRLHENVLQLSGAGGNVVVLEGSDGVVLVDGGLPAHSHALLSRVLGSSRERPVLALFNTHWHHDHTGSNELLGRGGTRIVAHENTKLWLGADFYVDWEDRRYRPQPAEALPTETFLTSAQTTLLREDIEYGYLPRAHTDGDIYVFFRRANVLVAGDTLFVRRYPLFDYATGGWPGGMIEANEALLRIANDETRIVPGHGPVRTRADLLAQHEMLSTVTERLMQMMAKGLSAAEMLERAPTREFDAEWGDPAQFVAHAYRGLWAHVYALQPRPI